MKKQLNNAINYMESINVDLESFYAISTNVTGTTFQGKFESHYLAILHGNGFEYKIDTLGFLNLCKEINGEIIKVVFS
jgi:hypothetical protein